MSSRNITDEDREVWAEDARRMFQMDQVARLRTAFNRGFAVGEARAEAKAWARGELLGVRQALCRIGRRRLGEPSARELLQLTEITDINRLHELLERALVCSSWESLLADEQV